jgi:hypothetical protein
MADGTDKAGGVEGIVAPRYLIDITRDLKPEEVPFQPWARRALQEAQRQLQAGQSVDPMPARWRASPERLHASV